MTIVVLGCKVTRYGPGKVLVSRLARALECSKADPREPIIVSGHGEALLMARWLIDHGVPAQRVTMEPTATSTNENLERSWALIEPRHRGRLTVVTSDFHVWRTKVWAWQLGIPVRVVAAVTPPPYRELDGLREAAALLHSSARVVWRRLCRVLVTGICCAPNARRSQS